MGNGAQALLMGTERGKVPRAASSRDTGCHERHPLLRHHNLLGMAFSKATVLDHGGVLGLHRGLLHRGGHCRAPCSMGEKAAGSPQREKNRAT